MRNYGRYEGHSHRHEANPPHNHNFETSTWHTHEKMAPESPARDKRDQVAKADYGKIKFDRKTIKIINKYFSGIEGGQDENGKRKRRQKLPSGLEKKKPLPAGLKVFSFPKELTAQLPSPQPNTARIMVEGGHVVLLHRPTNIVLDIIRDPARSGRDRDDDDD